jgi:phosphate transport system substrate-binding protein
MPVARASKTRMTRTLRQLFLLAGLAATPLAAQDAISLVGSGSNLAGSLYSAWTAEYAKTHSTVQVRYLPLGTAESIKEIREGKGDFGGGEIPLTDAQKHSGTTTLTQFPTALVAIVPIYKLPGKPTLRFSGEVLAGMYLGIIKNWNDPRIAKLNPGVTLPDQAVTVVHLSGVKGSNYILSDFLSKTSQEWKEKIGKSASPNWPVGVEVARSEGLVTKVSATNGAIGYVELTYAKRKDIGYGSVQNAAGQFVRPNNASIVAAVTAAEKSIPEDLGASLTNAGGKDSYPLTSFTFIYAPASGLAADRSKALKEFWGWALGDGQEIANGLEYTVLPQSIAAKAREAVNSIQ